MRVTALRDRGAKKRDVTLDLNAPETWRWVWFVMALVFATGELVTPATFFFLPFALGAGAGSVTSFIGLSLTASWFVFVAVSFLAFISLWKLGRKLEHADEEQEGVGATRWIGQEAQVIKHIVEGGVGTVRLEREEWRAESLTGSAIPKGSTVVIAQIAGTRLVVVPTEFPANEPPSPDTQPNEHKPGSNQGA